MRTSAWFMISALALSSARADVLSPADREALLLKLESLREDASSKVEARFRAAIAAYSAASASSEAAAELYLKCVQKLNFEDQGKKASEFREWKKKEADKLSSPGHGLALRLQLNWLILTLRAAAPKVEREKLLPSVQEIIDAVVREAGTLRHQRQILDQSVTSSIFAKAYEIKEVNVENWPLSPGSIGQIYDDIILPPLRRADRVDALRAAWIRRIQQEMIMRESSDEKEPENRRNGNTDTQPKSAYETFVLERVPELQWQMELDLFANGDQQAAALRMLDHLEKHIAHKSARRWTSDLERILNDNQSTPQDASGGTGP